MDDAQDPIFPPLLTGHAVPGAGSSLDHAVAGTAEKRFGAGDVVWSRDDNVVDWAVVLEPEVVLAKAVQMMPLVMVATGDCLGALTPPQVAVTYCWPGELRLNGAAVGEVRMVASSDVADAVPDWIVIGVRITMQLDDAIVEPGDQPNVTAIVEEGGDLLTTVQVIESSTRHFLTWLNSWSEDGFGKIHDAWIFRVEGSDLPIALVHDGVKMTGMFVGLDEDGGLLLRGDDGQVSVLSLVKQVEIGSDMAAGG